MNTTKYTPIFNQHCPDEPYECENCGKTSYIATKRRYHLLTILLRVLIGLVLLAVWTVFVAILLAHHPGLLHQHSGPRNLIDQFPIVSTEFREDRHYVESDPIDGPFWIPSNKSDSVSDNAWNSYGNAWIWLHKDSPYSIPNGRPLVPLNEEDIWMKDYTAFITAYQQEIQCLGAIKHVLNLVKAGQPVTHVESLHVNDYCVEVIRQALSCTPDLTLGVQKYEHGEIHTPFWGGMKHQCRDREAVHRFLAKRNIGFTDVDGEARAFVWLLHD